MDRAHTITTTTIDRWLMPHIASILAYAETDQTFAATLAMWLDDENWAITPTPDVAPSRYLLPTSTDHADDIIDWLMHELVTHPEARVARSLMVTWASNYEMPQDVVIGIEGLALAGFPLGLINKKKQKTKLQIVVSEGWQEKQSFEKLSEQTHQISQRLIATELRKAGGKIGSLHPHTAEWSMGGSGTQLYTAPTADLTTLKSAAEEFGLHHTTEHNTDGLAMIAISPSIDDSFVEELVTT